MKGTFPLAVAAIFVATALPSCGTSKSGSGTEQRDAGAPGSGGKNAGGSGGQNAADTGPTPGSCKTDGDCTPEEECTGRVCAPKAVCPATLLPMFDSLKTNIFSMSCGTNGGDCHSHDGSVNSGGLNLADDPYTALLGSDGKGAPANNIAGSEKNLVRVVPGDPDHSFLVIKLSTHTGMDPKYGSGMPFPDPGSVCPDTLKTIRDWITAGGKK